MNNYEDTFLKKIAFIVRMVTYFGAYEVPNDWWDVSVERDEPAKPLANGKVHDASTSFVIKRLDRMYKQEYEGTLQTCNIKVTEDKKGIHYKNLNNDKSKMPGIYKNT